MFRKPELQAGNQQHSLPGAIQKKSRDPLWESLKRERRAHAPLATHSNSKQRAHNDKAVQRRSKGGSKLENGISDDVDHQRGTASKPIGHPSKKQSAYRPHRQCDEDRLSYRGDLGMEIGSNGADAKNQDKEIKCVERPAEEAGDKRISLDCTETAKTVYKSHGAKESIASPPAAATHLQSPRPS